MNRIIEVQTLGAPTLTVQQLLRAAIRDARNAWSIGTFGAIGEFMRDGEEAFEQSRSEDDEQIVTARGALEVSLREGAVAIAYDTLSADGETWGHAVAFCLPRPSADRPATVSSLGGDRAALRPGDRDAPLFDLGIGLGHVRMCVRTRDEQLGGALRSLEGGSLFGHAGARVMDLILKTNPHRVVISPLARIEVYAPIPGPKERSPSGPHTHVLPKLLAAGRTHGANAPIPAGLQPVLMLHPRSPWRDAAGRPTAFNRGLDEDFERLFASFGLSEDKEVRAATEAAVLSGTDPETHAWPRTRRGRAQARITLRRLAQRLGPSAVSRWRTLYDRAHAEDDDSGKPLLSGHEVEVP